MTETQTPRDEQATGPAPQTGGVPLLVLVLSGKLALREHRLREPAGR